MNRRQFVKGTAAALAAAGVGSVGYAIGIEPHWLEVVEQDLPIDNLPDSLAGKRLIQLSDLHVGPRVSDEYLARSLDRVRSVDAAIVVVTGDFISVVPDMESLFARLRSVLSHLPKGRVATLGILGNHDYGIGWRDPNVAARVVAEAERAGMRILRNETASVGRLDVLGIDDLWSGRADPAPALRSRQGAAQLTLVHNPDAADRLPWQDYRGWMLAGHTHGGQCKPPFLPPPLLPVENRRYVAGVTPVDARRTLYISRGIGHLIRARFNVRPEITVFTMRKSLGGSVG
jgi:predicted MPP superfamily phosphohydrolase